MTRILILVLGVVAVAAAIGYAGTAGLLTGAAGALLCAALVILFAALM